MSVIANSTAQTVEESDFIDLREYLRIVMKRKTMIVLITIVSALTSALYSIFLIPPLYESKAVLMVTQSQSQRQSTSAEGLESVVSTVSRIPEMTINSYVGQAKAPILLERVIRKLDLDPVAYTVEGLSGMVTVQAVKDTNIIEIKVRNNEPELATRIANTLSEQFLIFISEKNQEQMAKSIEFLQNQVKNVERELAKATEDLKNLNAIPRSVNLLEKEIEKKTNDFTEYQSRLILAQVELDQLEAGKAKLEQRLSATPEKVTVTRLVVPGVVGGYVVESPEAAAGQNTLTVPVEEVNPAYISLVEAIAGKEAAIAEKRAEIEGLRQVIVEVQKGIEDLQAELTAKRAEQNRLQRKETQLQEAYALLSEKITETQVAKSIDLGEANLLLVAPAIVPSSPIKPNKKLNVAVATVLGLMVSVLLAFAVEYLDNTFRSAEDLERHLGLSVLAVVPEASRHQ